MRRLLKLRPAGPFHPPTFAFAQDLALKRGMLSSEGWDTSSNEATSRVTRR